MDKAAEFKDELKALMKKYGAVLVRGKPYDDYGSYAFKIDGFAQCVLDEIYSESIK